MKKPLNQRLFSIVFVLMAIYLYFKNQSISSMKARFLALDTADIVWTIIGFVVGISTVYLFRVKQKQSILNKIISISIV